MSLITPWTGTRPGKNQSELVFNAAIARFIAYVTAIGPEIDQAIAELLVGANVVAWTAGVKNPPSIFAGSDGHRYACIATTAADDDPVNSTSGCWVQLTFSPTQFFPPISSTVPIEHDIRGYNASSSGNVVTVTPGSCMDSTGTIALETSENKTVTLPGTVNGDFHIFVVRKTSDSSTEIRAYSTVAGPASDTAIDSWRRLSFAKNNGSGVTMPFIQVGDRIDWITASKPQITATTTNAYVAYSVNNIIPISVLKKITLVHNVLLQTTVTYSYNGVDYHGTIHITGARAKILPVDTIYLAHDNLSTFIKAESITLRR